MSSKKSRRSVSVVDQPAASDNLPDPVSSTEEQPLPYDSLNGLDLARNQESEDQLRSVLQNTAIVKDVIASEDEGVILLVLGKADLDDAQVKMHPTLLAAGWKITHIDSHEGFSRISVEKVAEVTGWWDGQSFRGDIPEITLDDIKPFLPDHGRLDITVIANAAGCTFLHVDKLLTHAEIPGLRKIDRVWWIGEVQAQPEPKVQASDAVASVVDPAHLAQVEALKAAIEQLSPEAKAQAAQMGLIAGARRSVKSTDPVGSKPPRAAKVREQHECACGCGGLTFNAFCMGHDARAKGRLQRAINGKLTQDEMGWKPNANLVAYVRSHPDWDLKFGAWLGDYEASVQELGGEDEVILDTDDSVGNGDNEE